MFLLLVWVNPHLPDYVQTKLRRAMEKSVSDTDKPGYIYTYQLLESMNFTTHQLRYEEQGSLLKTAVFLLIS